MNRRTRWTLSSCVVAVWLLGAVLLCVPVPPRTEGVAPRGPDGAVSAVGSRSSTQSLVTPRRRAALPAGTRPVPEPDAHAQLGGAGAAALRAALDEARELEAADLESMRQVMVEEGVDDAWRRSLAARAAELAGSESELMLVKADCRATICRVVIEHPAASDEAWLASLSHGAFELLRVQTSLHDEGLTRTELFLSR